MKMPLQFKGLASGAFREWSGESDEDRVLRVFAGRQLRLLRQHLRNALSPADIHCEGPNTYFYLSVKPQSSWLGNFTFEKHFMNTCVLLGRVGYGKYPENEEFYTRLRTINRAHCIGSFECEDEVLEHRHRQILSRDISFDEVSYFLTSLCGCLEHGIKTLKSHFGVETPHEFACRFKDVLWARPEDSDLETDADEVLFTGANTSRN